ncbi:MAG TPA: hypothetical protein VF516_22570, partial [Kofleriaceae bacterium]
MRYLALATYLAAGLWGLDLTMLAGCGAAPPRPIVRAGPGVTPARDLATARTEAPREPHDERKLSRDPRVIDLDIIRITARAKGPG